MRRLLSAALGAALAVSPMIAHADDVDGLAKQLVKLDGESQDLSSGIKKTSVVAPKEDQQSRRLIDAEVEFGEGNFEGAALRLYDYVNAPTKPFDYDTGLYYLGESLYQKGDRVAARTYFTQLVTDYGQKSKFYQQSLERLLELTLLLEDSTDVDRWLQALDALPTDKRDASVPYARGKYAFSLEKYADAAKFFAEVPADSAYAFQAQYYLGVTQTAQGDLGAATKSMATLIKKNAKTDDEKRVLELGQLALGRLYYERDQPTKAIDSYLLIDRHSSLFDEALYEVAWVYVKAKAFDKALRALELLALADPTSSKLPTVKILEGNLRIRKAQGLHADMVMGIEQGKGNPTEEYLKADRIFSDTKDTYQPPYDELSKIITANSDPRDFMVQITGRVSQTFAVGATMPEIAAAWVREEPDVQRVVGIETDLGDIQDNITEAQSTVDRLDAALSSKNRVNIFPTLAEKRDRATEILEELFTIRTQLATHEYDLAKKSASGAELTKIDALVAARQKIAREMSELPNADVSFTERVQKSRDEFDAVDQSSAEIQTVIDSTEATMVALQKYMNEVDPPPSAEQKQHAAEELSALTIEVQQMRQELTDIRRETTLGKDEAGTGDEVSVRARSLRDQLRQAFDAEHKAMKAITDRSGDSGAGEIDKLEDQVGTIQDRLDGMNLTIDQIVDAALVDVKDTLDSAKADLSAYRQEFLLYEAESRGVGGTVLGDAFHAVKTKFYDVIVRSDVGVVDTSWSQTEDSTDDLKRLELDRTRELNQLRDEFKDILDETTRGPQAPPATPSTGGTQP
jgi:hypothetical protein